jgi:hypothetical protein
VERSFMPIARLKWYLLRGQNETTALASNAADIYSRRAVG